MKIAYLTNIIPPYMHHVFEALGKHNDVDLSVLSCSSSEPGRNWISQNPSSYYKKILRGLAFHLSYTQHLYVNPEIFHELSRISPDIIFICGFSPTMAGAAIWAKTKGRPYGVATDGWKLTDPGEWSKVHRFMRQMVIPRAVVGVGASNMSLDLLAKYGLPRDRLFVSPLVSAVPRPRQISSRAERPFDILWCGNIDDDRKGVVFFAEILIGLKKSCSELRVRVAGEGPMKEWLINRLKDDSIRAQFDGYLQQGALTEFYNSGKLFLFPSRGDPWGLVVNEAVSAGTPVIASNLSGAGIELSAQGDGIICMPLDSKRWIDAAMMILNNDSYWQTLSSSNIALASNFDPRIPAGAILTAARIAMTYNT